MFICRYCDEEFESAKELKKHEKICEYNPDNDAIFRCRCGRIFRNKDEYKKHLRSCSTNPGTYEDLDAEF